MRPSQPQAGSVEHLDVLKPSSDYAHSDHQSDCSEGEDDEPVVDDECGSPSTVTSQPLKPPKFDEWRKYCKDLGKKKGSRANVFRCTYLIVQDNGPPEPCNLERAKSTIKRHIDTVHLHIR